MNTYRIVLKSYKPNGDLFSHNVHFVDHENPTQAQIDFLEDHVVREGDITEHPAIGTIEFEAKSRNGLIFRTSDVKLVRLVDAY